MFFYLLSRNRSMSGVPGKIRGTCNPDPDSWVRTFISWWIGPDGFPIRERSGKLRWFIRRNDEFIWADYRHQLMDMQSHLPARDQMQPKSVTFIPSRLEDNPILMDVDPNYRSNLQALSYVDRMQLLEGNWDVRPAAGNYFKREWFEIVDAIPAGGKTVRYWDRASSEVSTENPDPDFTAGIKMTRSPNGLFFIQDSVHFRGKPLKVESSIKNTASLDGRLCEVGIEQDPGQAGVMEAEYLARQLAGYTVKLNKVQKDKVTRASPLSAQCEAGNVKLVRGPWNEKFLAELEQFPDGKHDDQVDAASGAFYLLTDGLVGTFTEDLNKRPDAPREKKQLW
jgi:predicted phage terminase large subunit-like protein